jgi:hypothetical protein
VLGGEGEEGGVEVVLRELHSGKVGDGLGGARCERGGQPAHGGIKQIVFILLPRDVECDLSERQRMCGERGVLHVHEASECGSLRRKRVNPVTGEGNLGGE